MLERKWQFLPRTVSSLLWSLLAAESEPKLRLRIAFLIITPLAVIKNVPSGLGYMRSLTAIRKYTTTLQMQWCIYPHFRPFSWKDYSISLTSTHLSMIAVGIIVHCFVHSLQLSLQLFCIFPGVHSNATEHDKGRVFKATARTSSHCALAGHTRSVIRNVASARQ